MKQLFLETPLQITKWFARERDLLSFVATEQEVES